MEVLKMQRKIGQRKVDELGRFVLPMETRTELGIQSKSVLDVYINDDSIILKRNLDIPVCAICGESGSELTEIDNTYICSNCIARIKDI